MDGTGTRVDTPELGEIGTVVFDSNGPRPVNGPDISEENVDFTLIQLDPGIHLQANPEMLTFQGPTGYLSCSDLQAGSLAGLYGNGLGFRQTGQQRRTGPIIRCNTLANVAEIAISVSGGDSGGPVLQVADGKAIGHEFSGSLTMVTATMDTVFSALAAAGFGNVALATIDGGFVKPPSE